MRVLVLGGSGFIGSSLVPALMAAGHAVDTPSREGRGALDAMDDDDLRRALRAHQYGSVVNLLGAGLARGGVEPHDMAVVNTDLPRRLAGLLAELDDPPVLVHAASSTERLDDSHDHESEYSRTKWEGSQGLAGIAQQHGLPVTIARIHNTYGPRQPDTRFVMSVARSLADGTPVTLQHPDRVRDFVYVDDVAASLVLAAEAGDRGLWRCEIGTGTGLSLREAAHRIAAVLGRPDDLIRQADPAAPDPHPVTLSPVAQGTFGVCTTTFDDGITETVRGM